MRAELRRTTRLAMPVRTDVHAWGRLVPGPEGAPPVPVRIYRQFGSGLGIGGPGRRLPGIVYYHGGSWVTGDLDTHDASCRMLAATARCLVVAVDYRLAPEHPFPAAVDDAVAAYAWVQRHADELGIDPHQVGVMGDSAGGNLAAVVALETRDGGAGGGQARAGGPGARLSGCRRPARHRVGAEPG
jgi:acetyl esterase